MPRPLLFLLLAALLPLPTVSASAATPDIPRLPSITIDGALDDWAGRGFLIENLAPLDGRPAPASDLSARARLGWDEQGLLFAIEVTDNIPAESASAELYNGDSVELFLARAVGSADRLQVLLAPGLRPAQPAPRVAFGDHRQNTAVPASAEIARAATPTGYHLEARIPWTMLGWSPAPAETLAVQIILNDADQGPGVRKLTWFPGEQSASDSRQLNAVRLAETASPPDRIAWRWRPLDPGRLAVTVTSADPTLAAPRTITAREAGRLIAQLSLVPDPGGPRSEFILPSRGADIALALDDQPLGLIPLKSGTGPSTTKINRADYSLTPAVFSGDAFPAPRLAKPADIEALLGPVALTPRYFNAAQQEVAAPSAPGRYGVVYEIKPLAGGPAFTRFQTLYKLPQPLDWRTTRLGFDTVSLPPELALDPAAVRNHRRDFNDLFNDAWRTQLAATPDTAVVLAAISDEPASSVSSSASAAPVTARDNAWRRDQDWWYPLRKKLGLWTQYDHVVYTPDGYAAAPGKRWPLLLFLHGSGDGENRTVLHKWGPPRQIAQGRKLPFIVVAPRSPPGPTQWWYAPQLGELLDDIEKEYRVDKDRIYVTGLSMGGYGTWRLASEFPHRFAAIAPICGGWDETEAPRLAHLPAWVFHGDQDNVVPAAYSVRMVDALKKAGAHPRLTLYPGVGHNCWEPAYSGQELYDWLLTHRLPAPK